MDFSSTPSFKGNDDVDRQLAKVQEQLYIQNAIRKLQIITDKCFEKCVTKPGTSLDSSQQKCTLFCMDRYTDTEKIVTESLTQRLQQHQ
ncbi:Mitochondrial import inner membrane translocase subunit Tim13 [Mactra antiquata]